MTVNGQIVHELGMTADPNEDLILVDGELITLADTNLVYFIFNKPRGCVSTTSDPQGRPTVMDYFTNVKERIYPVGRLDYSSEGLMIFTNDGEVANKLMHPSSNISRTYAVKLKGVVPDAVIEKLRQGVRLSDGFVKPLTVTKGRKLENKEWVYLELSEGKNLEVRRIFSLLGFDVERLRRIAIGPVELAGLGIGKYRPLLPKELRAILEGKGKAGAEAAARPKKKRRIIPHQSRRGN